MFNNNFNNNQISVNTRYESFASDTSTLTIGGWNKNLSVRITPAVGVDQNGNTMYDRNRSFQTALTKQNAFSLIDQYDKELRPYINGEKEVIGTDLISVAVPVGREEKRTIVAIEIEPRPDGDGKFDVYFSCYSSLDQNNRAIEANVYRHRFQPNPCIKNYNYQTGSGETGEVLGAFKEFIKILETNVFDIPFAYHAEKYEKAVSQAYSSARNNGSYNNNGYQSQGQMPAPQQNYSAPMTTSNGYQTDSLPFLS